MRTIMYVVLLATLTSLAAGGAAHAQKGKDKPKDSGQFDDLFGKPADKGSSIDEMKKATEGMGGKKADTGMAPKVGKIDEEAKVIFLNVFAAQNIVEDKKLGCQPMGKDKRRLTEWTFDELPAKANSGYDVCLTLQSAAGREMSMRLTVIDPRGSRVNNAESNINFAGRAGKIDHVVSFPAPIFKTPGQYFYVIDLDGKEAGRLPLFRVKVEGETSGHHGSGGPSDLPPKAENTPPSGPPPKDASDNPLKAATSQDP